MVRTKGGETLIVKTVQQMPVIFVLKFYCPVNPYPGSYPAWSVYLTTLLLGRLSPLRG